MKNFGKIGLMGLIISVSGLIFAQTAVSLEARFEEFQRFLEKNSVVYEFNRAPTNISLYPESVAERSLAGTMVGTLTTTDPDMGDSHTNTLLSSGMPFTLDGDRVITSDALDFETRNQYELTLRTTDAGGLIFEKPVTIAVTDVREFYTVTVRQAGAGQGTVFVNGGACNSPCQYVFEEGQEVRLAADATVESVFAGWSEATCSGSGDCVFPIRADVTVTAAFESARPPTPQTQSQPPPAAVPEPSTLILLGLGVLCLLGAVRRKTRKD